jgi:hypothetical protein
MPPAHAAASGTNSAPVMKKSQGSDSWLSDSLAKALYAGRAVPAGT